MYWVITNFMVVWQMLLLMEIPQMTKISIVHTCFRTSFAAPGKVTTIIVTDHPENTIRGSPNLSNSKSVTVRRIISWQHIMSIRLNNLKKVLGGK